MAKLKVISAIVLVALLAIVAEASFRTTINTIVEEEDNQWGGGQQSQSCQQQIHLRMQQLRQCEQMLSQGMNFEMETINKYGQQQQYMQCCQGLESINKECRCEAVNQMMQEMMQQQQRQYGEKTEEMMEKARYLPDMCNLEARQCQIQSPY